MRLLLDTHTYLWELRNDPRLSMRAAAAIADPANDLYVSVASLWEATIKIAKGTLSVPGNNVDFLLNRMDAFGIHRLSIEDLHLRALQGMPLLHRDPFDRIIVAQAQSESMTLLTVDGALAQYGIPILW